jgi:hypothetical protein
MGLLPGSITSDTLERSRRSLWQKLKAEIVKLGKGPGPQARRARSGQPQPKELDHDRLRQGFRRRGNYGGQDGGQGFHGFHG